MPTRENGDKDYYSRRAKFLKEKIQFAKVKEIDNLKQELKFCQQRLKYFAARPKHTDVIKRLKKIKKKINKDLRLDKVVKYDNGV